MALQAPEKSKGFLLVNGSSSSVEAPAESGSEDGRESAPGRDGGWAWVMVLGSFSIHVVISLVTYSFAIIYVYLNEEFNSYGDTALIQGANAGTFFGFSAFAGKLTANYGSRRMTQIGAFISSIGLVGASFCVTVWQYTLTYGVVYGVGNSIAFNACIDILDQWFHKKKGLALGIAVSGAGIGPFIGGPVTTLLIQALDVRWYFRIMAVATFLIIFGAGLIYHELHIPVNYIELGTDDLVTVSGKIPQTGDSAVIDGSHSEDESGGHLIVNLYLLKDPIMICFCSMEVVICFGYLIPITHIVEYAREVGIPETSANLLVSYFGICSTIGRIFLGYLADRSSPVALYVLSMGLCGVITAISMFYENYLHFALYFSAYGFLSGSFISLAPYLISKYMGRKKMAEAFGLVFSFGAPGNLLGPPIAGWIHDETGNYELGFLVGGVAITIAALLVMALPLIQKWKDGRNISFLSARLK